MDVAILFVNVRSGIEKLLRGALESAQPAEAMIFPIWIMRLVV